VSVVGENIRRERLVPNGAHAPLPTVDWPLVLR
jgi:hypothetical protein